VDRFVVQEHHASHLHWDFRLELDGVLASWAIPKGPPADLGIKRLAIRVEDHAIDYIDFQGTIPEGEYGAGTVEIWDKGHYRLIDRKPGSLEFELFGKKLKGIYKLVRMREKNWLIFKVGMREVSGR